MARHIQITDHSNDSLKDIECAFLLKTPKSMASIDSIKMLNKIQNEVLVVILVYL